MSLIDYTPYKLKEWVPIGPKTFDKLSLNPRAIQLLEHNKEYIDWRKLLLNPQAILLIEKELENTPFQFSFWTLLKMSKIIIFFFLLNT